MRVLVWQWGRRGAGPRLAALLADALNSLPGTEALLSLSSSAEILQSQSPPRCQLPIDTYSGWTGLLWRLMQAPLIVWRLVRCLRALGADTAICAMPGPLDMLMRISLQLLHTPVAVIVHDAELHPGDGNPLQMFLQRRLIRGADAVVALSEHVAARLRAQYLVKPDRLRVLFLPPLVFGPIPPPPRAHGGAIRLLFFGRLLPYKGLDLLADAVRTLDTHNPWQMRVVGSGPDSLELTTLREMPHVTVENRWVPEDEIGELIAWADIVVLPYREASQSGVAGAAVAAGRFVVGTRVGGLTEQLRDVPTALLCQPDAASLTAGLRHLIDAPQEQRPIAAPVDPRLIWRDMAQQLIAKVPTHADTHHRRS